MTNRQLLAVSVVCPLGAISQQFYVGPDCLVVRDVHVFLSFFGGSIVTIKMGKSTRSRLEVSTSLGVLQY